MPTSSGWSKTWTFFEGDWHEGNLPIMGARSHASLARLHGVRRRARFEGVVPDIDLHCARVNASAKTMALKPIVSIEPWVGLVRDGMRRFEPDTTLYIRPMYWAERAGPQAMPPRPGVHALVSHALRGADAQARWVRGHALAVPAADARYHAGRRQGRLPLSEQRARACSRRARAASTTASCATCWAMSPSSPTPTPSSRRRASSSRRCRTAPSSTASRGSG